MPLNISGSLVSSDTAEALKHKSVIQRNLHVHLEPDSEDHRGRGPYQNIVYDQSGTGKQGTMYSGTSLAFDGSNDWIEHDQYEHPYNCTLMVWIKTSTANKSICSNSSGGPVSSNYSISSSGYLRFHYHDSIWREIDSNPITVTDGNWHHVVFARNGTNHKMYKDGELIDEATLSNPKAGAINAIGRNWSGYYFDGLMSDYRIYSTQLSGDDIAEIYKNPTTMLPGSITSSQLYQWIPLTDGSGTKAYDVSGNNRHGTLTNMAPTWTGAQSSGPQLVGKGQTQKMTFDGSNDYVDTGDNWSPGAGDFTFSCWVYMNSSIEDGYGVFIAKGRAIPGDPINGGGLYHHAGNEILFDFSTTASSSWSRFTLSTDINGGTSATALYDKWTHVAVSVDRDGLIIGSVNGIITTATGDGSYPNRHHLNNGVIEDTELYIGTMRLTADNGDSSSLRFDGLIDEVAVWDRVLSIEDIQKLAATDNPSTITSPTNSITAIIPHPPDARTIEGPSLRGYWRNTGTGTWQDLSGQGNNGTIYGSPTKVSFPEGVIKGRDSNGFPSNISSFSFDGSSSYIQLETLSLDGDETISIWFNSNQLGTGFLFQGGDGDNQFSIALGAANGASTTANVRAQGQDSSSGYASWAKETTAGSIETGKWYNITATKTITSGLPPAGTVLNMYLNGVNDTNTGTNWWYTPDNSYILGKRNESGGTWVNGRIGSFMQYGRILSSEEILHNFNVQRDKYGV